VKSFFFLMPNDSRFIENIRYEILEQCQDELVSGYKDAVSKAEKEIPNFFALPHPKEFRFEVRAIRLFHSLHLKEQGKNEEFQKTVKYWAESMEVFMEYTINKKTKNKPDVCYKYLSLVWNTFLVNTALSYLGSLSAPWAIDCSKAGAAFASLRTNHAVLINKNWLKPDFLKLEGEIWRWAWGERRMSHHKLLITHLQRLMHSFRETFAWLKTRRLIHRLSKGAHIVNGVSRRKCLPPPPTLSKNWKTCSPQAIKEYKHTNTVTNVKSNVALASPQENHELSEDDDGIRAEVVLAIPGDRVWPPYVRIGAEVRYRKSPDQVYTVLEVCKTKLVLKLKRGVLSSSNEKLPVVEVTTAAEIEDASEKLTIELSATQRVHKRNRPFRRKNKSRNGPPKEKGESIDCPIDLSDSLSPEEF